MTFDEIFEAYHNLYRAEAETPDSTDDEYTIGMRLANEAINHWATYDSTKWKELFTTRVESGDGDSAVATADVQYDAPEDMQEAGGHVKVLDSSNKVAQLYPILEPQDVQFKGTDGTFAYFTGDPANGYVLNLNPSPGSNLNGLTIDYVYYKKPTLFTTGTDVTEMSNPYFIVHRMLANRYRVSRNPFYTDALRDAENALAKMKMANDSGNWANPWSVQDKSGTSWGS